MLLGYNTNGFAHHDPLVAIDLLTEIGYRSVALTIDHGLLNPFSPDVAKQLDAVAARLEKHALRSVIETGSRFLLDPRVKHEPTLVSAAAGDRERRISFLKRAIDIAQHLSSDCVSLWAGAVRDGASDEFAWRRLSEGLGQVLEYAEGREVAIGFEPEPGMFIDTMDRFRELTERLSSPALKLTLDVGHLHCQDEVPIAEQIHAWRDRLVNVHIEDMRRGVHEHLMFGEGDMEFGPILAALRAIDYAGGIHVELSRHSHDAVNAAKTAMNHLTNATQR